MKKQQVVGTSKYRFWSYLSKQSYDIRIMFRVAISIFVGGVAGLLYIYKYKQPKYFREHPLYQESVNKLAGYEPASKYIGNSIKPGRVKSVLIKDSMLVMTVPVRGENGNADLIVTAEKYADGSTAIHNLALKVKNKEWIFYKSALDK